MAQYHIGKRQDACASCKREFADGEEVTSCVYATPGRQEAKAGSLTRADFCKPCWDAGKAPEHISNWRRKVQKKEAPRRFDRKAALELFRILGDSEEPKDADVAYVLALLLLRKKVFDLARAGTEDGRRVMILRLSGGREEFRVVDRELTQERLEAVKSNLESIFEGGGTAG